MSSYHSTIWLHKPEDFDLKYHQCESQKIAIRKLCEANFYNVKGVTYF